GTRNNFFTMGEFSGAFGKLDLRFTGGKDEQRELFLYGQIVGQRINLSKILANEDLGVVSMQQNIDFTLTKEDKIEFETGGTIDSLQYGGYTYKDLNIFARMRDMSLDSLTINTNTDDLKFVFTGSADFTNQLPAISFRADAEYINLQAIVPNTDKREELSFNIHGTLMGNSPDNLVGDIVFEEPLVFKYDTLTVKFNDFKFSSVIDSYQGDKPIKKYKIDSEFAELRLTTTGKTEDLISGLKAAVLLYNPASKENQIKPKVDNETALNLNCVFKNTSKIIQFVDPSIRIAQNTSLSANFDAKSDYLNFRLYFPTFKTKGVDVEGLEVKGNTAGKELFVGTTAKGINIADQLKFDNFSFKGNLYDSIGSYFIGWEGSSRAFSSGKIDGDLIFDKSESGIVEIGIDSSYIIAEGKKWNIPEATIISDSSSIAIQGLSFKYRNQQIGISGAVSESPKSQLKLSFNQFKLENLSSFLPKDTKLEGNMNGDFSFRELYKNLIVIADNRIDSIVVNDIYLGDMFMNSEWNSTQDNISFLVYNVKGKPELNQRQDTIDRFEGYYWPGKDSISADVEFNAFSLSTFKSLYQSQIFLHRSSFLKSKFELSGYTSAPIIKGEADLHLNGFGSKFLNTFYTFKKLHLTFDNSKITISETKLISGNKQEGFLKGKITHDSFKNFNFDISLKTNNLKFLDINPGDTLSFYGTAYGTGNIYFRGSPEHLKLNVDIKTNDNTSLFVPLSSSESLEEEQSFMIFEEPEQEEAELIVGKEDEDVKTGDMSLDLNLQVTPGAELQLIMDQQTGDIMKVRGVGDLNLNLNKAGDLSMFGNYTIEQGDYLFTLQSFFSKHFTIRKGGVINWTGNPEEADVNLTAAYSLHNVGLYSLVVDPQMQNAKTDVDCVINMKGNLGAPKISFGVEFPEEEEQVSNQIKALEQDEINEQFLSLLLIGSFQPLPGLSQEASAGSPVKIGELVSNQLNRRLANISDDVGVEVNYQEGTDISTDELEVALSTRLWNDRILLKGNAGVGGGVKETGTNPQASNVVGEVEMNMKLNPSGSLQLKAYNKANDEFSYDQGLYTQGLGFLWKKEFDKIRFFKSKDTVTVNKTDTIKSPEKN
ncbi:MAG: translocation/assembly module TamB domain-containing protein, partial [Bacteroidota bacterium]|nr:translocation/assembly module TamB domain-containing protein [Bacteroidota bacterium]